MSLVKRESHDQPPILAAVILCHAKLSTLQHPTGLHGQIIHGHLEFRDGRAEFWMLPDFFLQGLQNLVSTGDMRCRLGRMILLGIRFS